MTDPVMVRFAFEDDGSGWPPVESEGLWAIPVRAGAYGPAPQDLFAIDNTPWFVRGVAVGDLVSAVQDDEGTLWATDVVEHRGRVTLRIIALPDGPLSGNPGLVASKLEALGASCEVLDQDPLRLVAVDLGHQDRLGEIKELLRHGDDAGWWEYEEGCITDEWQRL